MNEWEPQDQFIWKLKIISGPQMGAELPLTGGDFLIGSHDDCDLIFRDPDLRERHLLLSLGPRSLKITPHGPAPVMIDGDRLGDGFYDLEPFQLILAGNTFFTLGPNHGEWPDLQPPAWALHQSGHSPTDAADGCGEEHAAALGPDGAGTPGKVVSVRHQTRSKRSLVCVSLLIVFTLAFSLTSPHKQPPQPETSLEAAHRLQALLDALKLDQALIYSDRDGQMAVGGYAAGGEAKKELIAHLRQRGEAVAVRLHPIDLLLQACEEIFTGYGMEIVARWGGNGQVRLEGFVDNERDLQKALTTLASDVPGLTKVDNKITTSANIMAFFETRLRALGLEDKVFLEHRAADIHFRGTLTAREMELWQTEKLAIKAWYRKGPALTERITLRERPEQKVLRKKKPPAAGLDITAVHIGSVRYITCSDGKKYFEGTRLKTGHIIKSIDSKTLHLDFKGQTLDLNLGGSP